MKIIVVFHLPCKNNELGLCTGMVKQGISNFGRSLAHYIRLPKARYGTVRAIFSSTLPRAVETVKLCFGDWGVPTVFDHRLCAIDYGDCHSLTMKQIVAVQHMYMREPFPNGESYANMALRYRSFFEEARLDYAGLPVILIGHYGTRELLRHLCQQVSLEQAFEDAGSTPSQAAPRETLTKNFSRSEYSIFEYP